MKRILVIIPFLLAGCATGTGTHWYAPATWFSHAPANALDAANKKETAAEHDAIKLAQRAAHETQESLRSAPVSRPVSVAAQSAGNAVALLDQAVGPLTAPELATVRQTIAGLLSENVQVRAEAEAARKNEETSIAEVSTKLAKAQAATEAAEKNLRMAFDRENELANELRSEHALRWILLALVILAAGGWAYVRYFMGGIPGAVGSAIARLEAKSPSAAEDMRGVLDTVLNRHEQAIVRSAYLQSR